LPLLYLCGILPLFYLLGAVPKIAKLDKQMVAARGSPERVSREDLSERELEVLTLVSRGANNREIAESLTITENTVKVHLRHILERLDLRNHQRAAAYAVQEGLVKDVGSPESEEEPSG
jgi:DNA-binding NarL/FixJ family response regulator